MSFCTVARRTVISALACALLRRFAAKPKTSPCFRAWSLEVAELDYDAELTVELFHRSENGKKCPWRSVIAGARSFYLFPMIGSLGGFDAFGGRFAEQSSPKRSLLCFRWGIAPESDYSSCDFTFGSSLLIVV